LRLRYAAINKCVEQHRSSVNDAGRCSLSGLLINALVVTQWRI